MTNNVRVESATSRSLYEVLSAFSLGFLGISLLFIIMPSLQTPFTHFEVKVNLLLHIRQTDFIRGYLEYASATIALAVFIWALLRVLSTVEGAKRLLGPAVGTLLLTSPVIYWAYYYERVGWAFGWPYRGAPLELLGLGACLVIFLSRKWVIPTWIGITLVAAHFMFWYLVPGTNLGRADYSGPIAPVLGFCASVAWGYHVLRDRYSARAA